MGTRIEDHLGSQQVARVVYGAIIGMALVGAGVVLLEVGGKH